MLCQKFAGWATYNVDPDEMPHFVASHLGIHCYAQACLSEYIQ